MSGRGCRCSTVRSGHSSRPCRGASRPRANTRRKGWPPIRPQEEDGRKRCSWDTQPVANYFSRSRTRDSRSRICCSISDRRICSSNARWDSSASLCASRASLSACSASRSSQRCCACTFPRREQRATAVVGVDAIKPNARSAALRTAKVVRVHLDTTRANRTGGFLSRSEAVLNREGRP